MQTFVVADERKRLRARSALGDVDPREWAHAAREARDNGPEVHLDMMFGFFVEKNSDLPNDGKRRAFNGRVVSRWNQATSRKWKTDLFKSSVAISPSWKQSY